jgi:hypothetical protein
MRTLQIRNYIIPIHFADELTLTRMMNLLNEIDELTREEKKGNRERRNRFALNDFFWRLTELVQVASQGQIDSQYVQYREIVHPDGGIECVGKQLVLYTEEIAYLIWELSAVYVEDLYRRKKVLIEKIKQGVLSPEEIAQVKTNIKNLEGQIEVIPETIERNTNFVMRYVLLQEAGGVFHRDEDTPKYAAGHKNGRAEGKKKIKKGFAASLPPEPTFSEAIALPRAAVARQVDSGEEGEGEGEGNIDNGEGSDDLELQELKAMVDEL